MFTRHNKCNCDYASHAKNKSDLPVYICRGQGGRGMRSIRDNCI